MRTWRRWLVVVMVVLVAADCSGGGAERTQAPTGPPAAEPEAALALGRESMYRILNVGSLEVADQLLDDVWALPRHPPVRLQTPLTWTEDPYQETYWRFIFYSLRPTSDLLWAYYTTGDARYRDKLVQILRGYLAADARRRGLSRRTFDNRHTSAFRAMVLVNSYGKLARSNDLPADLRRDLPPAIGRLGGFLADPQNFEEDQNHGFSEAAALLLVAENFPRAPQAGAWRKIARQRLDDLLEKTVGSDGVEIENSPFYHFYVLNFLQEIAAWAKAQRIQLSRNTTMTIHRMMQYAVYITLPDGHIPLLGASVDLDVRGNRPDLYAALADDYPEFEFVRTGGHAGRAPHLRNVLFVSSGQSIITSGVSSAADLPGQTHIVFDIGPYRTSHSHLDALSLTYYAAGRLLLPDSGLFTYDQNATGAYFHGTRAHNTVVVDGADQRPGLPVRGLAMNGPGWSYQSAAHHLYPGVVHRRSVLLLNRDLTLVADQLTSASAHRYAQTWHLFPGAVAKGNAATVAVSDQAGRRLLAIDQAAAGRLSLGTPTGVRQPMQGWISTRYGTMVPATALEYGVRGTSATFVTLLATGKAATAPAAWSARARAGRSRWASAPAPPATRSASPTRHSRGSGSASPRRPAGADGHGYLVATTSSTRNSQASPRMPTRPPAVIGRPPRPASVACSRRRPSTSSVMTTDPLVVVRIVVVTFCRRPYGTRWSPPAAGVDADDAEPSLVEGQRGRESDVAEPEDRHLGDLCRAGGCRVQRRGRAYFFPSRRPAFRGDKLGRNRHEGPLSWYSNARG